MLWNPLAVLSGLLLCSAMAVIVFSSIKRSSFGWLIVFFEYFYILGLGVFPLLLSLGAIDAPAYSLDYEWRHGEVTAFAFSHVALYALGAMFGYFGIHPLARKASLRVVSFAGNTRIDNYAWFYGVCGLSLLFSGIYFYAVGPETAIVNASLARGGDFSGLVGFEQYQFLKTLAMIGLFSMVFVPYIVIDGKRATSAFLVVTLVAIPIYLLTVARVTFFDTLVLFAMLHLVLGQSKLGSAIVNTCVFIFMLFVLFFGKEFVGVLSIYLFGSGEFAFVEGNASTITTFFTNFGPLVYSIDAGVRNFLAHGPALSADILLSPLGFLPSFVYPALGLDFLSYQVLEEGSRFSCVNTQYFVGLDECSVPPYLTGTSAYLFPVVGGFVFGFGKFWIYSVLEAAWIRLKNRPDQLWFPLFLLLIANRLMLFIPQTISFAVFVSGALFVFLIARKALVRLFRSIPAKSLRTLR